ncbi:MAG: tetratricopeptide repeat protein [Bryobacteraceae bacterium]
MSAFSRELAPRCRVAAARRLGWAPLLMCALCFQTLPAQPSRQDEEAFRNAVNAFNSGQPERARRMFEDVAAVKPEADLYIGRCNLELKDYQRAIASFESYLRTKPKDMEGRDYLGQALIEAGRYDAALAVFDGQLRDNPNYTMAMLNHARTLARLDRCSEAITKYGQVLKILPDDPGALKGLGQCSLKLSKWAEAADYFEKARALSREDQEIYPGLGLSREKLGQLEEAVKMYRYALRLKPSDLASGVRLAECYHKLDRPDDQIQTLRDVVRNGEKSKEVLEALANAYFRTNQVAEAKRTFLQLHLDDPNNVDVLAKLGRIHFDEKNYQEAQNYYEKAIKLNPSLPEVLRDLGEIKESQGDAQAATQYYHRACQESSRSVRICVNLARVYLQADLVDLASQELNRIRTFDPQYPPLRMELAKLSFRQGKLEEAAGLLDPLLEQDPKSGEGWRLRSRILQKQGRFEDAVKAYTEVLRLLPDDKSAYLELRDLYQEHEKWAELRDLSLRLLEKWPKEPESTLILALTYQQLGDNAKAVENYKKGFDLAKELNTPFTQTWPYINCGSLLYAATDYAGAAGYFRDALTIDASDQSAIKNLGMALVKQGFVKEAHAQLKRLQELKSPLEKELADFIVTTRREAR